MLPWALCGVLPAGSLLIAAVVMSLHVTCLPETGQHVHRVRLLSKVTACWVGPRRSWLQNSAAPTHLVFDALASAVLIGTGEFNWADLAEATAPAKRGFRGRRQATKTYAAAPKQDTKQQKRAAPAVDPSVAQTAVDADPKAGSGYRASIAAGASKPASSATVGIAAVGSAAEPSYEPRAANPEFLMPVNPEVSGKSGSRSGGGGHARTA